MTDKEHRQQIIKDYNVAASGRIRRPGKFEGEMLYVPFFWYMGLDGMADSDVCGMFKFRLTAVDKQVWPELKGRSTLRLRESEQGFVGEV